MSIKHIFLGLGPLICITACTPVMQLVPFNNTSGLIEVHFARKDIVIDAGSSARLIYPQSNEKWTLRISASGCEVTYLVPHYLAEYPFQIHWFSAPVNVQVEPDLAIYLVPPDTQAASNVGLFASLQTEGFPLRPTSRTCPNGSGT
jgi:hypothetical protein